MSWCDKLACTPAVGLRFGFAHQSSTTLLDALRPLFDKWVNGRKQTFSIEQQSAFGVQFITEDGYQYSIDHEAIVVEFRHRFKLKAQSGKAPVAELLSKTRPYTELLDEALLRLVEAAALINGSRVRDLWRIGVVTLSTVAASDLPPGVRRLIDYMAKPWGGNLSQYNMELSGALGATDEHIDRCIHTVSMGEKENNPDRLITVKFDWQRTYTNSRPVAMDAVKKQVALGKFEALKYFEDIAEGSRFDEEILKK